MFYFLRHVNLLVLQTHYQPTVGKCEAGYASTYSAGYAGTSAPPIVSVLIFHNLRVPWTLAIIFLAHIQIITTIIYAFCFCRMSAFLKEICTSNIAFYIQITMKLAWRKKIILSNADHKTNIVFRHFWARDPFLQKFSWSTTPPKVKFWGGGR